MSDDEFDYMSDAFILVSEQKDIRPGLIQSRSVKRSIEIKKRNEDANRFNIEKNKPTKVVEKEKLQDGLQTPLSSDNKGFLMMQKMGFKHGTGLGKAGEGRAEPIAVDIKNNREGLGVKAHIAEIRAARAKKLMEAKKAAPSVEDYRARIVEEANEKRVGIDLFKSQRMCFELDRRENVNAPLEKWFWPKEKRNEEPDDSDDDNDEEDEIPLTVQDKLEMITVYLRQTYYYCLWCGVKYDDESDLKSGCPGSTQGDH